LGAVPLYAYLAGRLPRLRLITVVSLFFSVCLALFSMWARPGAPASLPVFGLHLDVGIVFFIWVGIFNLMITAQFWAFANDVYTVDEGKRLFPIVAFGASLGAVLARSSPAGWEGSASTGRSWPRASSSSSPSP